jgi:hypothetical protein
MNAALLILFYVFVFVAFLIVVTDLNPDESGNPSERRTEDSSTRCRYPTTTTAAEIESLDLWSGDAGSRIGDRTITSQSDLPDFDSLSDSWDDSWGRDDW